MDVFDRRTNSAGRPFYEVRLASDPRGPKEWVQAVHVRSLAPTTAHSTRRQLAPTLDDPDSPPSGREAGLSDRRHLGEAQSSSGGLRLSPLDATPTRYAQDQLVDGDLAALLQVLPRTAHAPACTRRRCVLYWVAVCSCIRCAASAAVRRMVAKKGNRRRIRRAVLTIQTPACQRPATASTLAAPA